MNDNENNDSSQADEPIEPDQIKDETPTASPQPTGPASLQRLPKSYQPPQGQPHNNYSSSSHHFTGNERFPPPSSHTGHNPHGNEMFQTSGSSAHSSTYANHHALPTTSFPSVSGTPT